MERVLGHVDVEEMYLDVDPENLPDKGEIVETVHFFVGQAYNAHIHVVEKESGGMVMHIVQVGSQKKEIVAYPAMWSEYSRMLPRSGVAVSDKMLKYALPKVDAIIRGML